MMAAGVQARRGSIAAFLIVRLIAGTMAALAPMLMVQGAAAQDVRAAIQKANLYIEVAKMTERAADSWDRYASWVNMKTGPTGKERYISYGMYPIYDISGLLQEARRVAALKPGTPKLDAAMKRYMDAYAVAVPVLNQANDYYDRNRTIVVATHQVEEIQHVLTDLAFINQGRIVLACSMEDFESRYLELAVAPDQLTAARALKPIHERQGLGRSYLLYESVDRDALAALGEVRTPSIADLFIAVMGGGAA